MYKDIDNIIETVSQIWAYPDMEIILKEIEVFIEVEFGILNKELKIKLIEVLRGISFSTSKGELDYSDKIKLLNFLDYIKSISLRESKYVLLQKGFDKLKEENCNLKRELSKKRVKDIAIWLTIFSVFITGCFGFFEFGKSIGEKNEINK